MIIPQKSNEMKESAKLKHSTGATRSPLELIPSPFHEYPPSVPKQTRQNTRQKGRNDRQRERGREREKKKKKERKKKKKKR